MTTSQPARRPLPQWLPRGRGWWIVAGAFLAGLVLFLLLWMGKRDEFEFYRADGTEPLPDGQVFEPLPAPLPAGDTPASGMDDSTPSDGGTRIDRQATPPPVATPTGPTAAPAPAPGAAAPPAGPVATGPMPRLIHAPPPDYPRDALRAGISGEVVIRIDVGVDGVPASMEIVRSSRNRSLDRAALQAVRKWRFAPATRNGTPIAVSVQQTVSFDAPD